MNPREGVSDRRIEEIPALVANIREFTDAVRRCRANAEASPDGHCHEHRHGRKDWEKT